MSNPEDDSSILKTVEQLATFNDTARSLMSTLELAPLLATLSLTVSGLLVRRSWSLLLWDEAAGVIRVEAAGGEHSVAVKGFELKAGEGLSGAVFSSGKEASDAKAGNDPSVVRRFGPEAGNRGLIGFPLLARNRVIGVLEIFIADAVDDALSPEERGLAVGLAELAAMALDNAVNYERVTRLTLTDEHTGLFNARHLKSLLGKELERARRYRHPLSGIFIDLDHFKSINDTHGHSVGSSLLREAGELLVSSVRQLDVVHRYGGDEFVVILIETGGKGARIVADRIRAAFDRQVFLKERSLAVKLTASIGVASFPEHAASAEGLLAAADAAMYEAKVTRNTVVMARQQNP